MGRVIRYVPLGYEHPKDKYGQNQPMFDKTFADACAEWDIQNKLWDERKTPDVDETYFDEYSYADWNGKRPEDPAYYRPEWPEDAVLGIQLWENVTEGTPISPVFPNTEQGRKDLAQYAADNCSAFAGIYISAEEWYESFSKNTLESGYLVGVKVNENNV